MCVRPVLHFYFSLQPRYQEVRLLVVGSHGLLMDFDPLSAPCLEGVSGVSLGWDTCGTRVRRSFDSVLPFPIPPSSSFTEFHHGKIIFNLLTLKNSLIQHGIGTPPLTSTRELPYLSLTNRRQMSFTLSSNLTRLSTPSPVQYVPDCPVILSPGNSRYSSVTVRNSFPHCAHVNEKFFPVRPTSHL